ncbi:MAG: cation diffusion facilitator family transporter [Bacilli bacterium]|nr:cation diffusion facilitator family transporter [Bacilli bacterium]
MKYVVKTMVVSIIVNIILVVTKLVIGLISNYKSLVADAIHSFSDLSTDVIAIVGQWLSTKKPDKDHPYGHGKMEYITSLIIGTFILILGISMIYSVIGAEVVEARYQVVALVAVTITIILKYSLAKYVYHRGKKINNSILIASSKESLTDVLSACSVFITIILSMFEEYVSIFKYADKLGGVLISLLIIKTAYNILKENINAIIGESEQDEEIIYQIKEIIMSETAVLSIDNLNVMKFGSYYQIMLDVGVEPNYKLEQADVIAHTIEKKLIDSDLKIKYVSVHTNPYKIKH